LKFRFQREAAGPVGSPSSSTHGENMGLRHRDVLLDGVQFQSESILTEHGP
jgi:anthranilate/para-aminobenzoate synthase component II